MKDRIPQPAKIFAGVVLGYIFAVIILAVIGLLVGNEFRVLIEDIVKCVNEFLIVVSPLLAAISVGMGAWSIHQSNEGGATMKKTVDEMQEVLETLRLLFVGQQKMNVSINEIKRCVTSSQGITPRDEPHKPLTFTEDSDPTT